MKRTLALILAIVICQSVGISTLYAAANPNANRLDLFFDDIVLRGSEAYQDSYFEIGKGLEMSSDSYLDLYISHSPNLIPEYSAVNILVDDLPIESIQLTADNAKETNLRIPINELQLTQGFHKITFRANMKVAIGICEDPQSSSAWMVLYQKSKIALNLNKSYKDADLSWYPTPYIARGTSQPLQALIVVPDQLGQAEFIAATNLSQYFTTQTPGAQLNIPIYTESDLTDALLRNHNLIWIGQPDRWHGAGRTAVEAYRQSAPSSDAQSGFLGTAISPWNENNDLLFLAGNDDQLMNGATILTTESLYRQLKGSSVPLPNTLPPPEISEQAETGKPYTVTLEKLGYNNLVISEIRKGTMEINYSLPGNWDLENGAKLNLVYSHSQAVLFHSSVMTVSLNGVPVKSASMTKQTADKAELAIDLPPTVIGNNRSLNIKVGLEFSNPPADLENIENDTLICADPLLGDWAVIDKTTSITFTPVERQSYYIQSLPYPFITNGQWDRTAFLFDDTGTERLNAAMTLIGRMGTAILPSISDLQLFRTSDPDLPGKLKDFHIIYVGTHSRLPDAFNGYGHSYVRFDASTMLSRSSEVELLEPLKRDSAVMQLTRSPFDDNRSLLLLSAATPKLLGSVAQAMANPEESGLLSSRISVIDSLGKVYPFPATEDPFEPAEASVQSSAMQWGNWSTDRIVFTIAFIFVILAIGILYGVNRRRKS